MKRVLFLLIIAMCSCSDTSVRLLPQMESKLWKYDSHLSKEEQNKFDSMENVCINHKYYVVSYNRKFKQANWVFYKLTEENIKGKIKRTNDFRENAMIINGPTLEDYKKSGYDRGHFCPAASMKISKESMSSTFLLSNVSPQKPSFNRGIWKRLEKQVRKWVISEKCLFVVTGPVVIDNIGLIGKNNIPIPGYYYKIIYDPTYTEKMIAFVLPNKNSSEKLTTFAVTVDEVERITGIDFFCELDDAKEDELESSLNLRAWDWNNKQNNRK